MTNEREKIAGTKQATIYRVEQRFNGRLVSKYYDVEEFMPDGVIGVRYAAFLDAWAAYIEASGWKDPGGA